MKRKITISICRGLRVKPAMTGKRAVIANGVKQSRVWMFVFAITLFLASTSFAQSGQTGPLTWVLEDSTLTISGEGDMPDYRYPSDPAPWCVYYESINTVIIETGVTSIGYDAFYYCMSLTSVTIPNSVTAIGSFAFGGCMSLTSITIPENVTTIGGGTFSSCYNLASIALPNIITTIEKWTFAGCHGLLAITLPNSVTTIKEGAFLSCRSLTSITLPNTITTIEKETFADCRSLLSITLPCSLINIKEYAFCCCYSLTSITIPNSVTTIENYVFAECYNLVSVKLPENLTHISDFLFNNCFSLTDITIPSSVTDIESWAFAWCISLPSITLPEGITFIRDRTLIGCRSLTKIVIPENVISIGDLAFYWCDSLTTITIPAKVKTIGESVFTGCFSLTAIEVDSENRDFISVDGVLFNKNKTDLLYFPAGKTEITYDIPNSVTYIEKSAFAGCLNLISMTIPNSVTNIKRLAFYHCDNLTSITLPKSVKRIEDLAFASCENLVSITNLNPKPVVSLLSTIFQNVNQSACTLTVPTSAVSAYQNAKEWKEFNIVGGGILVNPVANSSKYGYTIGDGLYQSGEMAEVMAIAHDGNKFIRWTIDGVEVSDRALYSFPVTEDVELVAHFEAEVGIDELRITNYELRVYPNPASSAITISAASEIEQLQIFDIVGRMVHSQTPENKEVVFDTGILAQGVYLVRALLRDGGVQTGKVVKN